MEKRGKDVDTLQRLLNSECVQGDCDWMQHAGELILLRPGKESAGIREEVTTVAQNADRLICRYETRAKCVLDMKYVH